MKVQLHLNIERLIFWLALVGIALWSSTAKSEELALDAFLSQVRQKHQGVQAAEKISTGQIERSEMGSLLLSPTAFGSVQYLDDRQPTLSPVFQGNRTKRTTYQLGVSKLFSFGLESRLYYNLNHVEILGANPAFLPINPYYEARPTLELTQSLWRNFLGAATRAEQEQLEAQALASAYTESYSVKTQLADAENSYWRLALARENVRVNRESHDRAVKIREWAARRARLQLSDRADLLQGEAALQVRQLELQAALDEERTASRAFNTARGVDSDVVPEKLSAVGADSVDNIKPLAKRARLRDDVKAAEQRSRLATANAELALQKLSPDLQVFGTLALNGRRTMLNNAVGDAAQLNQDTWLIGLRFSAPLDLPTILKSRSGAKLEKQGAELAFERRLFEQEQDWKDLTRKFEETRKRLSLARSIEEAQKQKLMYEKDRFNRGRTTTFQVLTFEQDYANAQLNRIRAQADLLRLNAQMKTYADTSSTDERGERGDQ